MNVRRSTPVTRNGHLAREDWRGVYPNAGTRTSECVAPSLLGGFTGFARLAQPVVLPFKGTFRMPFAMDSHARLMRSNRTRAAFYLGDASK
jgi:hypothetical protein